MTKQKMWKKKLNIVKRVSDNRWYMVMLVVEHMHKVIKAQWEDRFKKENPNRYPLDVTQIETWSTYDGGGCIRLEFAITHNKLICEAHIWDGNLNGHMTKKKFIAKLQMPMSFLKHIGGSIDNEFTEHCLTEYDDYLEKQKKDWVKARQVELLKD